MINILSHLGMDLQSEVCLWTLLGLLTTIFDATLFKVNANLKQVWQMSMPEELSMSVQRVLRTMISGVMLVKCFTVYVYLATYIVLLYPVFLEERPTLVLPWLLLAAVRKLLCEMTSLALGLATCLLLGPAKPPCVRFVVIKIVSFMPAFYMWMLVLKYYHALKLASTFKSTVPLYETGDQDYGLELAVRRRCTKSLLGEDVLRKKLVASLYRERQTVDDTVLKLNKVTQPSRMAQATDTSSEDINSESSNHPEIKNVSSNVSPRSTLSSRLLADNGAYEDWFGNEVILPRGTDRILEQFVLMLLRIGVCIKYEGVDPVEISNLPQVDGTVQQNLNYNETDTPSLVGTSSSRKVTASYISDYPQIFMKKPEPFVYSPRPDLLAVSTQIEGDVCNKLMHRSVSDLSDKLPLPVDIERANSKANEIIRDGSRLKQSKEFSLKGNKDFKRTSKGKMIQVKNVEISENSPVVIGSNSNVGDINILVNKIKESVELSQRIIDEANEETDSCACSPITSTTSSANSQENIVDNLKESEEKTKKEGN